MTFRPETFGDLLRQLRVEKALTQEELAEQAGMSVRGISDLERGRNRFPYRATVLRLIGVLGPREAEIAELWALAARRRGPVTASAAAALSVRLPRPLTAILGREQEQSTLLRTLRWDGARLVTLTGPGGVGKTRLALEVAAEATGDYADGVNFVSLAAVADERVVPSVIVAALGIQPAAGSSSEEMFLSYLADREQLLVLDNFEQILDAGTFVVELLSHCPRIKALITSRAPLRMRGEHLFALSPLPVSATSNVTGVEDLAAAPATELFLERARAANPTLEIHQEGARAIAEICWRLDGLPLAIELAAAQIRSFSPQSLLAQLESCLAAPTHGYRDLPSRQQTVSATIDWSYRLLSKDGQVLFRRLAVFSGGASVEAATAVCGQGKGNILPSLSVLHDASLLVLDRADPEAIRVRMLQTVRQQAHEKLVEEGEVPEFDRRHATYFVTLAEEAGLQLVGSEQLTWMHRLQDELNNVRAALNWARTSGEIELGLRLASPIWRFWMMTGQTSEGRYWLLELLHAENGKDVVDAIRAAALYAAASLLYLEKGLLPARDLFMHALDIRRQLGDVVGMAECANGLGVVSNDLGEYREGDKWFAESIRLRSESGDVLGAQAPLSNLANNARYRGEYERAIELYEQALALQRQMDHTSAVILTLTNVAQLLGNRGEYERAGCVLQEALARTREHGLVSLLIGALTTHGAQALEQGKLAEAEKSLEESLELCRSTGDKGQEDYVLINLAELAIARGDALRAIDLAERALARLQETGHRRGQAFALLTLGEAARMQGEYDRAAARLDACTQLRRELEDPVGMADTLEARARLAVCRDEHADAARLYGSASAIRARFGTPLPPVGRADYECDIATLRDALGDAEFSSLWKQGAEHSVAYLPENVEQLEIGGRSDSTMRG